MTKNIINSLPTDTSYDEIRILLYRHYRIANFIKDTETIDIYNQNLNGLNKSIKNTQYS